MDGDGLSSLGEKGKVRTFVAVKFFYIVDQLLMRSLWLEKLTINNFAINSDFHIFLLLKDQTNHYQDIPKISQRYPKDIPKISQR